MADELNRRVVELGALFLSGVGVELFIGELSYRAGEFLDSLFAKLEHRSKRKRGHK